MVYIQLLLLKVIKGIDILHLVQYLNHNMKIAIDVRPLTSNLTGIGRYTQNILSELIDISPEHEWFLYAHRPLTINLPKKPNVHIRTGNLSLDRTSTIYSQIFFPIWAHKDEIDIFCSPLTICLSSYQIK